MCVMCVELCVLVGRVRACVMCVCGLRVCARAQSFALVAVCFSIGMLASVPVPGGTCCCRCAPSVMIGYSTDPPLGGRSFASALHRCFARRADRLDPN